MRRRLWDQPDRDQYAILLGQYLRLARLNAGLSIEQAGKACGFGVTTVGNYEKAQRAVTVEVLLRIAAGYGCQLSDLMPERFDVQRDSA